MRKGKHWDLSGFFWGEKVQSESFMIVSLFQSLNTNVYLRHTLVLYLMLYQIFLFSIFVALSSTKVRANAPHFAPPMPLTTPYMKVLFNYMTFF